MVIHGLRLTQLSAWRRILAIVRALNGPPLEFASPFLAAHRGPGRRGV